jgi:hypothetical protein
VRLCLGKASKEGKMTIYEFMAKWDTGSGSKLIREAVRSGTLPEDLSNLLSLLANDLESTLNAVCKEKNNG